MTFVNPKLSVLNQAQIREIDTLALAVLEKTGIQVDDPKVRKVFDKAIGARRKGDRVYIPREVTKWAMNAAPSRVKVLRRDGSPGFILDSDNLDRKVFGIGVTNLYYQDVLTDKIRPFQREHMAHVTRLGNTLKEFDVISTPGVIRDDASRDPELVGALEMLANTQKPLIILVSKPATLKNCFDMYDELIGEKVCKSTIVPYLNPITPLIMNADTTAKMEMIISRGMPFIFSNYGMSGATCPITPGGTLAVLIAELLSGLVYSQLLKEGTPVILGSLPAAFDMRKMQAFYSPKSMLLNVACGEMMAHYHLPHCGTSGGSAGWGPDLLASAVLWMNHLTAILGKTGLIPFVGSNFYSLVFSPALAVYADEIIGMSREFEDGFSLDSMEVGFDEIISMGPGANYLMSDLTSEKFRESVEKSKIWPLTDLEQWEKEGAPKAGDMLRKHTQELLENQMPPEDHDDLMMAGETYINTLTC